MLGLVAMSGVLAMVTSRDAAGIGGRVRTLRAGTAGWHPQSWHCRCWRLYCLLFGGAVEDGHELLECCTLAIS